MNEPPTPLASSPLINPSICSLIVITPSEQDLSSISRNCYCNVRRNLFAIIDAARLINVPSFLLSPGSQPGTHALAKHLPAPPREFVTGEHAFPWQNPAFTKALAQEDKAILVLAGFWLEYQVLATALHALADSYDVYVLLDASPAKERAAARLSQDRLIQAGATPVVTSQVMHEWFAESDVAGRRALSTFL